MSYGTGTPHHHLPLLACGLLAWSSAVTAETESLVELGMGYDSNPGFLPVADEGTAVWTVHPQIHHSAWLRPDLEYFVQAGYQVNGSELDSRAIRMPSDPASPLVIEPPNNQLGWSAIGMDKYLSDNNAVSIVLNTLDHQHDNDAFDYRVVGVTPEVRAKLNNDNRLHLSLGWQQIRYAGRRIIDSPEQTQNDREISMTAGWWRRLSPHSAADLALRSTRVDSNEPSMASDSLGTTLRMFHVVDTRKRLTLALDVEKEKLARQQNLWVNSGSGRAPSA